KPWALSICTGPVHGNYPIDNVGSSGFVSGWHGVGAYVLLPQMLAAGGKAHGTCAFSPAARWSATCYIVVTSFSPLHANQNSFTRIKNFVAIFAAYHIPVCAAIIANP